MRVRTHMWWSETRSQEVARRYNAHTTNLDAPTTNLQNIKDKHADKPANEKSATPYLIHVLPLLNHVARNNSFSTNNTQYT